MHHGLLDSARSVNSTASSYYPFGEDKSTNPAIDAWKFGSYWRDSAWGLDYAGRRYYSSQLGRFLTADPYKNSAGRADPGRWNRYSYTRNDPVNRVDPRGLDDGDVDCLLSTSISCLEVDGSSDDAGDDSADDGSPPEDVFTGSAQMYFNNLSYVQDQLRPWLPRIILQASQGQAQAITNAYDMALELLLNEPQCEKALTAPGAGAVSVLESTQYAVTPTAPGSAAQTVAETIVFINPNGPFFATPQSNGTVVLTLAASANIPATSITFLNMTDADAFLLLHELGHQTGVFGPDGWPSGWSQAVTSATNSWYSWQVLMNCFGIQPPVT